MRGIIRTCRVSSYLILIRCSSTAPTVASYGVSDIWKRKGGMGARSDDNGDSNIWIKHDFKLHNFLKENIPEALAHTGDSINEHLTVLYIYIFICMYILRSIYIHFYIFYIHNFLLNMYIYIYMYIYICLYIYICIYIYIDIYIFMYISIYVCMYLYMYM
jgi:hypothetical protein